MRVVHCKKESYTHYIGRPGVLGNPFSHKAGTLAKWQVKDRESAIAQFREYALNTPKVLKAIGRLPEDAILGCWCKPLSCHGDEIVQLWKDLNE